MSSAKRWLTPSYGTILGLTAFAYALLLRGATMFSVDGDGARHIRLGREIIERGRILQADVFSHTRAGSPIVLHEWLSELALARADIAAGLPGVAVLAAILFAIAVLGVYRAADELGVPRPLALGVGLIALFLQSLHLLPRPHLFTTAMAALFLVVLLRFSRTDRAQLLAILPALMIVWANLHGGFLLGFLLLIAFLAGAWLRSAEFAGGRRAFRALLLATVACGVASLLTPSGLDLWTYTIGHLGGDDFLLSATQEFQSVDFHASYGKYFFAVLFAGPALWMTGRIRVSWLAAGLYLFFGATALHSSRNIPIFSVVVLPWLGLWVTDTIRADGRIAGRAMERLRRMDREDRTLRSWPWLVLAAGIVALAVGPWASTYRFDADVFPVKAVARFDELDTSGPVFNQMHWGGYLLYARPNIPVFIDGQTDFYGENLAHEYMTALAGQAGWHEVLDRHHVKWTLTDRRAPLVQLLALDPDWRSVYTDDVTAIYRRTETDP